MRVGLYNLEPKIVNTAMMQVSTYHKKEYDFVEIYNPLFKYDRVYAFSIFDYTDKGYVTKDMICGGTGFNIKKKLPKEIEECEYDYSLYPKCDFSIVWFSRGCPNNCKFCIVRKKEGCIQSVKPKKLNPKGEYIIVQDNNFFANPKWRGAIKKLKEWKQPVDFAGVDVRTLNKEKCKALLSLKHEKTIKIAWDNPKQDLIPQIKKVLKYIKPYRLMCYVLIGYDSTTKQDLFRIYELWKLKIHSFVMPYDKKDRYQKDLARWCNNKFIFKSTRWENYKKTTDNTDYKKVKR